MADMDPTALDRLRRQVENAHPAHKTMFVYVDDLRAALAALPEGEPTVKPLEWRGDPEWDRTISASTAFGVYNLHAQKDGGWSVYADFASSDLLEIVGDLDKAKAAAQADYEQRIRSALFAALPKGGPVELPKLVYSSALAKFTEDDDAKVLGYYCWVSAKTDLFPTMNEAYAQAKAMVARYDAALPEAEPVAWRWRAQSKTGMWTGWHYGRAPEPGRYKVYDGYTLHEQPLFAALPKGEPVAWQWRYRSRDWSEAEWADWSDWREGRAWEPRSSNVYETQERTLFAYLSEEE